MMAETEVSKALAKVQIEEKREGSMSSYQKIAVTKPFNFLVRIPKFDDETLREQIRLAKLHAVEKTKQRDAIQVQIQERKANIQIHYADYKYAEGEDRRGRKLVNSKRMEIDSLLPMINLAKNAITLEEANSRINDMEVVIQHQTLPPNTEKSLIHEIMQLKLLRDQLSSNLGSQDEIKQAVEQREEFEERLKILKKELELEKQTVLKAKAAAWEAERKYSDEFKKFKKLQLLLRSAEHVCQAAYAQWESLRKESQEKKNHYLKYKEDAAAATNYVLSRNITALHRLCTNQVENFMKLWNANNEFRQEYIKCSARNKIIPRCVRERVDRMVSTPAKVDSVLLIPNLEIKQETSVEYLMSDSRLMERKNQKVSECVLENDLAMVSGGHVNDEVQEEVDSINKAEETRAEAAEAKLKEEIIKANEARERKKRQAEKVQLRAELKAQKEAEQKEKEREKRLRKKERKKAVKHNIFNNSETAPSSEKATEIGKDMSTGIARKPRRRGWFFSKQSKNKSVPPPLRNRNKKIYRQYIWAGFISLLIFTIFCFIFKSKP